MSVSPFLHKGKSEIKTQREAQTLGPAGTLALPWPGLANYIIMEFRMRDRVCYKFADLYPVPLKGKCHIFCSRKAVQSWIYKIAVRYNRPKIPIVSVKLNRNPSHHWVFQLMVYKCGQ